MLILGSKKLDFWNSQEYRFFELEIHHYSFLLEFVEFLDEIKTPEIKKNMKFGHHSVHPSNAKPPGMLQKKLRLLLLLQKEEEAKTKQ